MSRRVDRRWIAPLGAICLLVAVAGPAVAPVASATSPTADDVVIQVSVHADGDAAWRVEYRYRLENESEAAAFDRLRARIDAEPQRYTERFAGNVRPAVARAADDTGREMALSNVTVTAGHEPIPQGETRLGTVTYRYSWEGFAATNDSHLRVGDAIDGFYLSPRTELLVTWPTDYEAVDVVPAPDERGDRRAVWMGELTFADDEPRVQLERTAAGGDSSPTNTETPETADGSLPVVPVGLALLTLAGLGLGGTLLRRRRSGDSAASVDPDLLSPREQVHHALEDSGGRMKQQELAEACDWHPSKTSKVLSDLQESGDVQVFRIGRENVVTLPEVDVTDDA